MSYYATLLATRGITLTPDVQRTRDALTPIVTVTKPGTSPFDPTTGQRICCVCHEPKPPDAYTSNSRNVDGKDARCKPCKSRIMNAYNRKRQLNREMR